jgi:pimeloyl-ACP methyl ester carboxylesterase
MLDGALGILDDYFMRLALHRLFLEQNYSVAFVGHSLGAGTAALMAAEFRNGIQTLCDSQLTAPGRSCQCCSKLVANMLTQTVHRSVHWRWRVPLASVKILAMHSQMMT